MDITTIERYVQVRKQLLLFVFRAEDDEPEFRPPYVLTEAIRSKQEQEKSTESEDRDEDEGFDDGENDGGPDEEVNEEVDEDCSFASHC
jgi:hypothetical protein